jgi:hypothetical protein
MAKPTDCSIVPQLVKPTDAGGGCRFGLGSIGAFPCRHSRAWREPALAEGEESRILRQHPAGRRRSKRRIRGTRTHGPRIRNPVLYPSELRGRWRNSPQYVGINQDRRTRKRPAMIDRRCIIDSTFPTEEDPTGRCGPRTLSPKKSGAGREWPRFLVLLIPLAGEGARASPKAAGSGAGARDRRGPGPRNPRQLPPDAARLAAFRPRMRPFHRVRRPAATRAAFGRDSLPRAAAEQTLRAGSLSAARSQGSWMNDPGRGCRDRRDVGLLRGQARKPKVLVYLTGGGGRRRPRTFARVWNSDVPFQTQGMPGRLFLEWTLSARF